MVLKYFVGRIKQKTFVKNIFMKKILLTFAGLTSIVVSAQQFDYLDVNNIKARVNSNGLLFNDPVNGLPSFEAPINSSHHSFFSSGLWIGGKDINDSIFTSIQQTGLNDDFQPGPVMDTNNYSSQANLWNRVWKINLSDINYHIANYTNVGYIAPQSILDWPANGNISLGQNQFLAPYADVNNNSTYDPLNGDYPLIRGDQCVYFIFNDETPHNLSTSRSMGIEIRGMLYAFNCPQDSALMNSVFLNLDMRNVRSQLFFNAYASLSNDIDVGCPLDDFIGTDVQRGTIYGYNGDPIDEDCMSISGYDSLRVIQALCILGGLYQDVDYMNNPVTTNISDAIDSLGIPYSWLGRGYSDSIIDNERLGLKKSFYVLNDTSIFQFYNNMAGMWTDSTLMVYGGTGHESSAGAIANGLVNCDYLFPSDSDPLSWSTQGTPVATFPWDEISEGNSPADRKVLATSGPITWNPGARNEIDAAFTFTQHTIANVLPMDIMKERIDSLHSYFIQNMTPCGMPMQYNMLPLAINENIDMVEFSIFPNPADEQITISVADLNKNYFTIYNSIGQIVFSGSFISKTTVDVSSFSNGIYYIKLTGKDSRSSTKKLVVSK